MAHLVIEMSGVTLVMGDRTATALHVSNWFNVTLKGLTIKYAELPTNQVSALMSTACNHKAPALIVSC